MRRLETLEEMHVMEENRLSSGVGSVEVEASLEEHITTHVRGKGILFVIAPAGLKHCA
jgi:hypothetical protein